jgi:hypothetical protein
MPTEMLTRALQHTIEPSTSRYHMSTSRVLLHTAKTRRKAQCSPHGRRERITRRVWPHICNVLKQRCMSETGWNRLVLEKPFGPPSTLTYGIRPALDSPLNFATFASVLWCELKRPRGLWPLRQGGTHLAPSRSTLRC